MQRGRKEDRLGQRYREREEDRQRGSEIDMLGTERKRRQSIDYR